MDTLTASALLETVRTFESGLAQFRTFLEAQTRGEAEAQMPEVRGGRQHSILTLDELFDDEGLAAAAVARLIEYDEPNTFTALASLEKAGYLEQVPGAAPKRWRIGRRHRRDRILLASRVVQPGEWTTYGDIAIAVAGTPAYARAVGSSAAKNPLFAHPHRVIAKGGEIPDGWSAGLGNGPEECRRRLESEGVKFVNERASANKSIDWEVVAARLKELEAGIGA